MALNEIRNTTENLPQDIESSINSQVAYYKLFLFRIIAKLAMGMILLFILGLLSFAIIFFLAISGAFALGKYLGSEAWGFLSIAGILALISLLIYWKRKSFITKPLLKRLSEIYFNKD